MNYLKIVRLGALYDLIVTFPFAFPKLCEWEIGMLKNLHLQLGLTGSVPDFQPLHYFFINLMGSVVIVWSLLRLRHAQAIFGWYDGLARSLFAAWMLYYLIAFRITGLVWFLFVPEITWAAVQFGLYARRNHGT